MKKSYSKPLATIVINTYLTTPLLSASGKGEQGVVDPGKNPGEEGEGGEIILSKKHYSLWDEHDEWDKL